MRAFVCALICELFYHILVLNVHFGLQLVFDLCTSDQNWFEAVHFSVFGCLLQCQIEHGALFALFALKCYETALR